MPQTLGWSPTTLETPKKGSPADLPSKQFFKDFFFKSPKKGGGSHQGSVPALSLTKVVGKFRLLFGPAFLRYGTLKLKGLECEILSYVEWMDRLGGETGAAFRP